MATRRISTTYRCWDDCKPEGCPGHTIELKAGNTWDYGSFTVDGEKYFGGNPHQLAAVHALLEEIDGFIDVKDHKEPIVHLPNFIE
jgi:hypothetical protein